MKKIILNSELPTNKIIPNRHIFLFIIVLILLTLLIGCAGGLTQLSVNIHSLPEGATLIQEDNRYIGTTPITLYYKVNEKDLSRGYYLCKGITAHWSDGTEVFKPNFKFYGIKDYHHDRWDFFEGYFYDRSYTFIKPQKDSDQKPIKQHDQQQQQQQQQQQTVVIPESRTKEDLTRGLVIVNSIPRNADVYVDGAFVGNSPCNLKLTEGIHIIEVRQEGFISYRKELRVIGSSEMNLYVTLDEE